MDFAANSTTPLCLHSATALVEHSASRSAFDRSVQRHNKAEKQLFQSAPIPVIPLVTGWEKTEELVGIARRTADEQEAECLLVACHTGDCQAVRALLHENQVLARQVVITNQSEPGYTALDVAAGAGYVEIVRLLLEAGADVNRRSGTAARTPLMQVCLHVCSKGPELPADLVQALPLEPQPPTAAPEARRPATPACRRDPLHCLRLLINSGADLDATDSQNRCALFHCANKGNSEALCLLTEKGAKVDGWSSYKNDPLNIAALGGHLACVQALVSAGAPIICARKHGYSALNAAAQNGHVEVVQYLLQRGVAVNTESTPTGSTPIMTASDAGQLACMQTLLAAGADPNHPDEEDRTALYYAACKGQLPALELLLASGAQVHGWSSSKSDPLCTASFQGHLA